MLNGFKPRCHHEAIMSIWPSWLCLPHPHARPLAVCGGGAEHAMDLIQRAMWQVQAGINFAALARGG
jgi:hypothetical protein